MQSPTRQPIVKSARVAAAHIGTFQIQPGYFSTRERAGGEAPGVAAWKGQLWQGGASPVASPIEEALVRAKV